MGSKVSVQDKKPFGDAESFERSSAARAESMPIPRHRPGNEFGLATRVQLSAALRELLLSLNEIQSDNEQHRGVPELSLRVSLKKAVEETEQVRDIIERLCSDGAGHHPDAVSDGPGLGVWPAPGPAGGGEAPAPLRGHRAVLTAREQEVLGLINAGSSNKEGAHQLQISIRTFEAHRAQIMRKFGARNAADLVRMSFNR
jgi:DNA-binding CsgD family transcriptional regulator